MSSDRTLTNPRSRRTHSGYGRSRPDSVRQLNRHGDRVGNDVEDRRVLLRVLAQFGELLARRVRLDMAGHEATLRRRALRSDGTTSIWLESIA